MWRLACLFSISLTAVSIAQPWQWSRVEADVYNPSGFPAETFWSYNYFNEICADFDGDGADEYFRDFGDYFVIGDLVSTNPPRWRTLRVDENLSGGTIRAGAEAMHLDRDGREELILFGPEVRCYKWVSSDPWVWERHDELLAGLWFPDETYDASLGDYDYDGLLNLVAYVGDFESLFYERDSSGAWLADSAWAEIGGGLFFDGDFDDDGDEDFAAVWLPLRQLDDTYGVLYENTRSGIERRESADSWAIAGPGGGDLDGDGEWEFLSYSGSGPMRSNPLGYHLQEAEPDTNFVQVTGSRALGRPEGIIEAKLRTISGERYVVNQYFGGSFQCPWGDCFRLIARGDLQWESYDFGLPWQSFGPGRLSLGNLNGDDHKDVLQVAYNRAAPPEEHWFLALWTGNEQSDFYSSIFELTQFASGPDSSFTSPQLCEIDGTHGAELVVLFEMTGGDARPVFYEIAGAWPNLIFTRRDEWGVGEWPTFERIRLADIDGDGLSELMGLANGEWQSWFYRQGAWGEYRNILPEFESSDVSFVDYDADGDLDLFTLADVYLNLTPDAADDPPVFVPQTLSLSTYPNPFNGEVHFVYELAVSGEVSLTLFDIQGRIVQTLLAERQAVGRHELAWDAGDLTSGVYFAKLEGMGGNRVAKLLLVK